MSPGPRAFFSRGDGNEQFARRSRLCIPYGKANSQYETEFEPATGTIWGYFKTAWHGVLQPLACSRTFAGTTRRARDRMAASVDIGGRNATANYYVCGSRDPQVFNLGGDLALFVLLIKARDRARPGALLQALHR